MQTMAHCREAATFLPTGSDLKRVYAATTTMQCIAGSLHSTHWILQKCYKRFLSFQVFDLRGASKCRRNIRMDEQRVQNYAH